MQAIQQPNKVAIPPDDLTAASLAGDLVVVVLEHEYALLAGHERHNDVFLCIVSNATAQAPGWSSRMLPDSNHLPGAIPAKNAGNRLRIQILRYVAAETAASRRAAIESGSPSALARQRAA